MNSDFNSRFDELELLNLKPSEKKILLAISKMALSIAQISRKTGISHSSLQYMVKKLHEKSLVKPIEERKRKYWKSNVSKILGHIYYLENKKRPKKSSKRPL